MIRPGRQNPHITTQVHIMSTRYVEKAAAKIESRSGLFSITSLCEPILPTVTPLFCHKVNYYIPTYQN